VKGYLVTIAAICSSRLCYCTLVHSLAYQFKEVVALNRLDMLFSPLGFVIAEAGAPAKCLAYLKKDPLGKLFWRRKRI
jgi:hypothetical protein